MNDMSPLSKVGQTGHDQNAIHMDMTRAEVLHVIGLIRDNGARLTAYLFAGLAARNDAERDISITGINRCVEPLTLAMDTLLGADAIDGLDPDALQWMRRQLHADAACLSGVKALSEYMRTFLASVKEEKPIEIDEIFASLDVVKNHFIAPFGAFIDRLQAEITQDRQDRIGGIQDGASRAKRGVERIDEIARTVRMVSINAQIEAARAGEQGRAFSIIAQEINALSDEISSVGSDVQDGLQETLSRT